MNDLWLTGEFHGYLPVLYNVIDLEVFSYHRATLWNDEFMLLVTGKSDPVSEFECL